MFKQVAFLIVLGSLFPYFWGGRGRNAYVNEVGCVFILTGLQLTSYVQCIILSPGIVTHELHEWLVGAGQHEASNYHICQKTKFVKPQRSHFDNVSLRLVLSMDHYCPWVGNTIGFHNRKFFLLILFYTTLLCWFLALTSYGSWSTSTNYMVGVMILNTMIGVVCGVFGFTHLHMVLRNETTIEVKYHPEKQAMYDLGWLSNVKQVMGESALVWFIPIYAQGPVGDGITWPMSDGAIMSNIFGDVGGYTAPKMPAPTPKAESSVGRGYISQR